jgi:dienelactone hydrolase
MKISPIAHAVCIALILTVAINAQVPPADSRNTEIFHTNYHFKMPEFPSLAAWEARKVELVKQILFSAGLLPLPERTPLHPQIFGRLERPAYSVEKVLLETLPGVYLGGNLYRPLHRAGKLPAVVNPHGHWTYGRLENADTFSGQALASTLAQQGYVVFAYDMLGYNDTIQTPHTWDSPAHQLWAFNPLGLQLWNSLRVVDFLVSLPEVDPHRIAATGASGGGTQTFLLTAVDPRVRFSAPVNMVSSIMQGGCGCENAPGLRIGTNNMEIAAMMAPRPMLLVAATGDWTRHVPTEEFPAIRQIYQLHDKPDNIEVAQFHYGHNYNKESREAVYRFFGKRLLANADPASLAENHPNIEGLQDMLALYGRRLPENALSFDKIFDLWKLASRKQTNAITDPTVLREHLRLALAAEWPKQVLADNPNGKLVLSRTGRGDRVNAIFIEGRGAPALLVHSAGAQAARQSPQLAALVREKRPVLIVEAFQTGQSVAPHDRTKPQFATFNPSDDACRTQDILTGLAYLNAHYSGHIELIGLGNATLWTLFAAAVAPIDVHLSTLPDGFQGSDAEFARLFFVPGIQRAGGFGAALALTKNRP